VRSGKAWGDDFSCLFFLPPDRAKGRTSRAEEKIGRAEGRTSRAEEKIGRAEDFFSLFFLSPSLEKEKTNHQFFSP